MKISHLFLKVLILIMYLVHEIEYFVKSEVSCPTKDQYFII